MLSEFLVKARKKKRKSLRQVEEETKIPNAHISQLENGKIKKPAPELLAKLAEYYNCDFEDLMKMAGYDSSEVVPRDSRKVASPWRSGIQNVVRIVTATDLVQFSDRRESESKLPEIVRKLITATSDISRIAMPSGDSVLRGGWDGKVIFSSSYSHPFIPQGVSLWEMGKGKNYLRKANNDLEKRTKDSLGEDIAKSTFVFVTTQRFDNKNSWTQENKKKTNWKEIVVIDADDLEHWLEIAPVVGLWLASEIGIMPSDKATPLVTFWQEWWQSTDIAISQDLLLKALPNCVAEIRKFLVDEHEKRVKLHAIESSIALAYLCSVIESIESVELRSSLWARCVIVDDICTFRNLAQQGNQLILIPTFENAPLGFAQNNGHKIFIATTQAKNDNSDLEIKRLPIVAIEEHLQTEGGLSQHEANRLARKTHGIPSILKRRLTDRNEMSSPEWIKPESGTQLIPMLLAGSWDSANRGDQEILSILFGKPYDQIERVVHSLCPIANPPCKKIGTLYALTSQEYVYSYLREYINPQSLDSFKGVVLSVLGEVDPKFELEKEERFAALVHGKHRKYSGALRKGLSISLALLATQPPELFSDSQAFVEGIIHELFRDKVSWQFWASISDVLQALAEASPDSFLGVLESLENNPKTDIVEIFNQPTTMGSCEYANILWSLECCAWDTRYLGRVIDILLYLSTLENKSSNWVNQPSNSVLSILRLWHPQTIATIEKRFEILDSILARNPKAGWQLLIKLLPSRSEIGSNNAKPYFRDWADLYTGKVTNKELFDGTKMICDRIPVLVNSDKNRWDDVLKKLLDIPFLNIRLQLLDNLLTVDINDIAKELRLKIWKQLEQEVYRHKEFPDAAWAIRGEMLEKLERVYNHFAPMDIYERYSRFFGYSFRHPECVSPKHDYKEQEQLLQQLQDKAIKKVFQADGLDGILKICSQVENPFILGARMSIIKEITNTETQIISKHVATDNDKISRLLNGYLWQRHCDVGIDWLQSFFEKCKTFNEADKVKMLLWLPFKREVWEIAKGLNTEYDNQYWSKVPVNAIPWEKTEIPFVIETFLKHNRPLAALCLLNHSFYLYDPNGISNELIMKTLNGILAVDPGSPDWNVTKHELGDDLQHVLETIQSREGIDKKELAKIEWATMPMTGYGNKPQNLVNWINNDPNVFSEIIEMTFRPEDNAEEKEELSEQKKMLANRGFDLLHGYKHVPGLSKDNKLDSAYLLDWVSKVRARCSFLRRLKIADDMIGNILANVPEDPIDGIWPHSVVRDILETYMSTQIEDGVIVGAFNKRGIVTKACFEGGEQERVLADQYKKWAEACEGRWVRAAKVLRDIEKGYRHEAEREDVRAEADQHFSE